MYRSVAHRDAERMLERGRALLDGKRLEGIAWARFVLLAAMVGAQASGRGDEARRLWREHGVPLYPNSQVPPHVVYVANWKKPPG